MIILQIDNSEVENIFVEGFQSNKEKFLAFIQNAYTQKASLEAYEADKKCFMRTYQSMENGSMRMYSQEEANKEIDDFLETV